MHTFCCIYLICFFLYFLVYVVFFVIELLKTMEQKTYGENSIQVAKTQKIIGTILILIHKYYDA